MVFFRYRCVVPVLTQSHTTCMLFRSVRPRLALTKKSSLGGGFYE